MQQYHPVSEWMEIYGIFQGWLAHIEHEGAYTQQHILAQQTTIDANIEQLQALLDKLDRIEKSVISLRPPNNA